MYEKISAVKKNIGSIIKGKKASPIDVCAMVAEIKVMAKPK